MLIILFYFFSSISPKQRLQAHTFLIVYRIPCQVNQKQVFLTLLDGYCSVGKSFQQCLKILGFMVKSPMISIYSRHEET